MKMYYTDQSNTTGYNNNNNYINNYFNKEDIDDEDELHFYEFGAHFQYKDLVTRLNHLLQLTSQEETNQKIFSNKNQFQVKKSRNITQTVNNMNFPNKDIFPQHKANLKNEIQFQLNNDNCKYENNNNIQNSSKSKQQSKTSEHSSTVHKQNKQPNQSSLVISSLTVTDKMSKLNNHIKTKTNSNSNCSYQNINNNNNNNNKASSPPSSINNKYIKTKISSIKYQNTANPNNTSSNKSNPNLILYPSSSKSKSQLKAISELLKAKIKKGKNSITNSSNISSYSSKSRNVTKPNNKTVHCILNHNNNINITNNNNNLNNCFDIQYPQSKPHSIERKVSSNNNSRKINSYHAKPKVNTCNMNGHSGKNTLFSPSLNSHSKNEMKHNNTTQYSQNSMNLSITTGSKRNNGYCGMYKNNNIMSGSYNTRNIKQKIISAGNNVGNSNSKMKCSPQQKQKVPSRNARNSSTIKNSINQTQNSHGNGNNVKNCNYVSKKGSDVNSHSNTINSHISNKRKVFTNSISINQAINTIMKRKNELSCNNVNGIKGKHNSKK